MPDRDQFLTWRDYAYVIGVGIMAVLIGLFLRWGS